MEVKVERPDQRTSSFLHLPAELRNRIYEAAFQSCVFAIRTGPLLKVCGGVFARTWIRTPGMLLACKQTCAETIDFYYELSTFGSGWVIDLANWLQELPKERQMQIRHLRYQEIDNTLKFPLSDLQREWIHFNNADSLARVATRIEGACIALRECELVTGYKLGHPGEICSVEMLNTSSEKIGSCRP